MILIQHNEQIIKTEDAFITKLLPANTLRFRFSQSNTNPSSIQNGGTWTKVEDSEFHDWDWTCNATNWTSKFDADNSWALDSNIDPDIKIIAAGDTSSVTTMKYMFYGCDSLTTVSLFDTSNVIDMQGMFWKCDSLTSVPSFDTKNVTNMDSMFIDCSSLTAVPLFDTSKVINMYGMFADCTSLTTVPLFNTSKVVDMYGMFFNCSSLTTVPLFDTRKVVEMSAMFYYCTKVETGALALYNKIKNTSIVSSHEQTFYNCGRYTESGLAELNQIPVDWGGFGLDANTLRFRFSQSSTDPTSIQNGGTWTKIENHPEGNVWDWTCNDTNWESKFDADNGWALNGSLDPEIKIIGAGDTSNVTNMTYMFYYCDSLTTVSLFDTSNVTNMTGVFQRCTSLTYVPLFDTSNVTNMNCMFYDCSSLTTVPLFNTSRVTDMTRMFYYCTSLTTVPLFDTKNVTQMTAMFYGCSNLTTVPLFDTSSVTSMTSMFNDCTQVKSGALALYQQASRTGKVTSYANTFRNCGADTETGLAELQQIPESWGGLKLNTANTLRFRFSQSNTNPSSIQNGGTWTKVAGSKFNDWDWTCNATNWAGKFTVDNNWALDTNLDPDIKIIAAGDTSNVTNMTYMFYNCNSLTSVSLFDTSNVTDIDGMFADCTSLTTVPLFDISSVPYMYAMFNGCSSLTSIPLFDTSNVRDMSWMFNGCTNVESGALALSRNAAKSNKNIQHDNTFTNCGKDTYTGNIELQQIPADWGGTANGWTS